MIRHFRFIGNQKEIHHHTDGIQPKCLLDRFLKLPHQAVSSIALQIGADLLPAADFSHLPTRCKFIALTPQWNFLNFLAKQGKGYATFDLRMQTEATDLVEENGRAVGLIARTPNGTLRTTLPIRRRNRNNLASG